MSTREPNTPPPPPPDDHPAPPSRRRRNLALLGTALLAALVVVGVAALLVNIFERRQEARNPYLMFVEVDENTTDAAVWGVNWPRQYESFRRTVDYERTRYGGSDAIPRQKLDEYPWLRLMWAGHAFSIDYRESRGHAYTLHDQDHTERVAQRRSRAPACTATPPSSPPTARGGRRRRDGGLPPGQRHAVERGAQPDGRAGQPLVEHPVSCVDCHSPDDMSLRITRPRSRWASGADGVPRRRRLRREPRRHPAGDAHLRLRAVPRGVLLHPGGEDGGVPVGAGDPVEQMEAYYDSIGFSDWTHGISGGGMLKAQHPEFELWSQGAHAQAGVSCADCHMPYGREGALKVSDHHVRSPLLNVQRACQTCHNVSEEELVRRAHMIQDRTHGLINRAGKALEEMLGVIASARAAGATDAQLAPAVALQRSAQWRVDLVYSEGSHGFHAPQETARLLGEALDYSRQAELAAARIFHQLPGATFPENMVGGVTPDAQAPPGPYREGEAGRPARQGQR
jgi:nitrite reductase (cytochrome c-552)